jgi:probable rRNA maturation factor
MVILRKPVAGLSEPSLARFIQKAARAVKLKGAVHVMVTGNREMQTLNRRFRGKDKPTDVLSFPPITAFASGIAGDIAISAEIAARNAKELGHATALEVKTLCLHGLLHLAGYDHERDDGAMAKTEQRLRVSLGLPVSLIERVSAKRRLTRPKP